jgi:hypothetical protein
MGMCAHPTIFDVVTKNMQKKHKQKKSVKEQTQKIDSPRNFSLYYTHYRKAEKKIFLKKVTS